MLYINNILMPEPQLSGIKITKEKVWSENTARTSGGRMQGDIVCIKRKVNIQWPPLTNAQTRLIDNEISNVDKAFVPIKYIDECGNISVFNVYFNAPSYTLYSYANGLKYVTGVAIDAIEQ